MRFGTSAIRHLSNTWHQVPSPVDPDAEVQPRVRRCARASCTTGLTGPDAAVLEEEPTSTVWSAHFGHESGSVTAQGVADQLMQIFEWEVPSVTKTTARIVCPLSSVGTVPAVGRKAEYGSSSSLSGPGDDVPTWAGTPWASTVIQSQPLWSSP